MRIQEVLLAGFGGQGVLSMGQFLCYAGMLEKKEVSWVPSYGPEMRGGTANCMVIVSDRQIDSPVFEVCDAAILMNGPSYDKFEKSVRPGGILLYNSSLIESRNRRSDITVIGIPANEIAGSLGGAQVANMVMIGALLELAPVVAIDSVLECLRKVLPASKHHLLPLNRQAMEAGAEFIKAQPEDEKLAV